MIFRLLLSFFFAAMVSASADTFQIWPQPPMPTGGSVATYPLPQLAYYDQMQGMVQQVKGKPVDLLFDGDEIMAAWPRAGKDAWAAHYAALHAADFGFFWDRIQNVLWRVENGELDGLDPKLIVLLAGTGNADYDSPDQIAEGWQKLVGEYRKRCPDSHILLLGLLPRGQSATDPERARISQINQRLAKLDDGKNITFLDIAPKFLEPDGTIAKETMLTAKSYETLSGAIQPIVDRYCPKDAPPVAVNLNFVPTTPANTTFPLPPVPADANPTIIPTPRVEWFSKFQGNLDKLKQGPYNLVFDGDSITDLWQITGKDVWQQHYGALKAADFGISADQTQNLLWRLQHGQMAGQDPKLIVLMIGTNNGGGEEQVAAAIRLILDEYEKRCPTAHILLLGIFPRGPQAASPARARIAKINKILATYDDGKRIPFLDIGAKFLQADGTLTADIMPDFLHPSARGYAIWADAIQPLIDKYFPAQSAAPKNGEAIFNRTPAVNDPASRGTLEAKELASGKTAECKITLNK